MNQRKLVARWILSFACATLLACNGGSGDGGTSTGGAGETGGNTGSTGSGGGRATGGGSASGGTSGATGGSVGNGGSSATGGSAGGRGGGAGSSQAGATGAGGKGTGGATATGGTTGTGGAAGAKGSGGSTGTGGAGGKATGGSIGTGGTTGTGGQGGSTGCTVAPGAEIGTLTDPVTATPVAPPNPPGIAFKDTDGNLVNAHGGGIIKVCDTYYMHGEYFLSTTTDNNFNGFSMYSSKNMATWKNEGIILPQQASGSLLGPNRKGERPHIIQCPSSGEFVLYAHAADTTYQADKEVVYATASKVTGPYTFKGALTSTGASSSCQVTTVPPSSCSGSIAAHSDMSALTDGSSAYVITESGVVYTLAADCHSWASNKSYGTVNGTTGGIEAPTVFKAGSTFYWIGSDKTGWRANDDFYSTAPAMSGPWTYQGYLAPQGDLTWMTQSTWVMPIVGSAGTTYVYWGDHWYGTEDTSQPGKHNNLATYVFQPLVFNGTKISLPTYQVSWKLDVGAGTWTPN
jgi:glycosyl hydrolase family 43